MSTRLLKTTVSYLIEKEDGKQKRINQTYLVNAVSFTDAEAIIVEKLKETTKSEVLIKSITSTDYNDIFDTDGDNWFACKVSYMSVTDEKSKNMKIKFLVSTNSVNEVAKIIKERIGDVIMDYNIMAITKTNIEEIFGH